MSAPFDLAETDRLLSTTRAVRKRLDLDRPVERSVILDCIRLAQQAPTPSNTQGWRFLVVDDPEKRAAIAACYRAVGERFLPSGRTIPVNYLLEGDTVYAGADGPWWRELRGDGGRGSVFIRGEERAGTMRAVEDDPALRDEVFSRLRPTAPRFIGTLVVIDLD